MAEKMVKESKMIFRMFDLIWELQQILPPIEGYGNQPLVLLEQTIKPFRSLIRDVEEMILKFNQNCQNSQDDLSFDELASIKLFTLEGMPRQSSFYFISNKTLRSPNRDQLSSWFLILRLFMFAISKIPSTAHRLIYRETKMDVSEDFPEGKKFI